MFGAWGQRPAGVCTSVRLQGPPTMNARFVRFTFNMTAARKPLALAQLMVWEHPPDCPTLTRAPSFREARHDRSMKL